MILSLNIMQPPADTEERLVGREVMLCFRHVYETDRLQQFNSVRFAFEFPAIDTFTTFEMET
jgi:hypothetical protein